MRRLRRAVVTLSVLAFLASSAYADIIPARYDGESKTQSQVVEKLTAMGVKTIDAQARVQNLTADEVAYFAGNAQRIQLSGQEIWAGQTDMLWYEWIGGLAGLGGAVGLIVWMANES